MPIRVSLAEALIMTAALNPDQARAVEAHARAAVANARTARSDEQYVQRHRDEVGYCPILNRETGGCSQYEARPTRCRDTFSAFPATYCESGTLERMTRREQAEYRREVARTPGTDGELHFIAPLEHLSEPIWVAAARAMRQEWGIEVWGDFWLLTTLGADPKFMAAVTQGNPAPRGRSPPGGDWRTACCWKWSERGALSGRVEQRARGAKAAIRQPATHNSAWPTPHFPSALPDHRQKQRPRTFHPGTLCVVGGEGFEPPTNRV
ncbi:YkgJ family cysteine cluster protein [Deinococcus aquaticus]|uniref:YkgJ family cysteine cluster protein n=1 Tax=Deinococcus aquaticus TaxID=328692 RepID=UPI003612A7FB